eukprot:TRINITY_DN18189_c0_g2_i3.p1 TRINITY_DN18189_c0_g2~~TRINITY_DN18189_c0_g2_i3.p1  ORF type:complete len:347 (-),score=53.55 TRINITY_DN18189_c0_g2_i3:1213-2253(-)
MLGVNLSCFQYGKQCLSVTKINIPHKRNTQRIQICKASTTQEDLWQFSDRKDWYEAKFCADDMPDWNPAVFVNSELVAPGIKELHLQCEISREKIPLRNAYKHVGQRAKLRVNGGPEAVLYPATPPFSQSLMRQALINVRGDLFAGEQKVEKELESVMADLYCLVSEDESEDAWKLEDGDLIEVGPFEGTGLNLRTPIMSIFAYPTIVMFVSGKGIASLKALIECAADITSLSLPNREIVRVYYKAPNEASLIYKSLFEQWEQQYNVVVQTTTGTFLDAFDDDDTLVYDPIKTAAVVLTGADEEDEKQALKTCKEAEITCIVKDSEQQKMTYYRESVTMPDIRTDI